MKNKKRNFKRQKDSYQHYYYYPLLNDSATVEYEVEHFFIFFLLHLPSLFCVQLLLNMNSRGSRSSLIRALLIVLTSSCGYTMASLWQNVMAKKKWCSALLRVVPLLIVSRRSSKSLTSTQRTVETMTVKYTCRKNSVDPLINQKLKVRAQAKF